MTDSPWNISPKQEADAIRGKLQDVAGLFYRLLQDPPRCREYIAHLRTSGRESVMVIADMLERLLDGEDMVSACESTGKRLDEIRAKDGRESVEMTLARLDAEKE